MLILDISDDQGEIDWKALGAAKDAGGDWLVGAVVAQATEGLTVTNSRYREYHDGAKTARPDGSAVPFGAYHFFYANDDGTQQAQHFLNFIGGYEGQVLPMIDCEKDGLAGQTAQTVLDNVKLWDTAVRATLNGKLPLIYFMYSFWKDFLGGDDGFSGHPAWPAAYNSDSDLDMSGTGWSSWTLWQFTDGVSGPYPGPIPGIATKVDCSRLHPGLSLSAIMR